MEPIFLSNTVLDKLRYPGFTSSITLNANKFGATQIFHDLPSFLPSLNVTS